MFSEVGGATGRVTSSPNYCKSQRVARLSTSFSHGTKPRFGGDFRDWLNKSKRGLAGFGGLRDCCRPAIHVTSCPGRRWVTNEGNGLDSRARRGVVRLHDGQGERFKTARATAARYRRAAPKPSAGPARSVAQQENRMGQDGRRRIWRIRSQDRRKRLRYHHFVHAERR